jgi:hypothetical protein
MKNILLYFNDDDNHIVCRVFSIDTLAPFVTIALSVEKIGKYKFNKRSHG